MIPSEMGGQRDGVCEKYMRVIITLLLRNIITQLTSLHLQDNVANRSENYTDVLF